ncbi:MAG: hypothetical protein RIT15_494 [Pseudomonadota bacterium]
MIFSRRFFYVFTVFLSILLVACGGGGGGSAGSSAADPGCYPLTQTAGTDPLKIWQWHLANDAAHYFASNLPNAGAGNNFDLNLPGAWSSTSGQNINVTVVDTGMEIAHEDLANNVVCGGSYNFITRTKNPTNSSSTGDHGTSVAGLIAGVANNSIGISGIAPKANLRGYNFLQSGYQSYANYAIAMGSDSTYGAASSDVFNFSAGTDSAALSAPDTTEDAVSVNTITLRSGKGALLVKSAGNGYFGMTSASGATIGTNAYCLSSNVTCQNVSQDTDNTLYSTLVVAAVDADSKSSSYSSAGSAIWVSGFGGEFGYDTAVNSTYTASSVNNKPALVTTDQSSCTAGYVRATASPVNKNLLNKGDGTATLNSSCNYTATFNGTSSAAPTVTGVIALMLQANSSLTWRDVRHILANTARKVQPAQAAVTTTSYFGGSSFTLEQGWVTNSAGFHFHNYFGFGLVDASAAVTAAGTHTAGSLGTLTSVNNTATIGTTTLPASTITGLSKTFSISGLTTVEQVEVTLYVGSGYLPYCNQVELTSPNNTKSILFNMDSAHTSASTGGIRLLSNAFYGETAAGTWTLKVINRCASPAQTLSTTTGQKLTIRGH